MKVNSIQVTYGELRSSGYPSFSNRRYEVTLSAVLQDGDIPEDVRRKLIAETFTNEKKTALTTAAITSIQENENEFV